MQICNVEVFRKKLLSVRIDVVILPFYRRSKINTTISTQESLHF